MRICVFEDDAVDGLYPLSQTRPAFDLRCGAFSLLQRQMNTFGVRQASARVRPEMTDLCRLSHPELTVNNTDGPPEEKTIYVNARWLAPATLSRVPEDEEVGVCEGQVAYVVATAGEIDDLQIGKHVWQREEWGEKLPIRPVGGRMIAYPWHLIEHNAEALDHDYLRWSQAGMAMHPAVPIVGPEERCLVAPSARIEPLVLIDTTRGPVLIDEGVVVEAFSRIEGPCYVGPRTRVMGAKLRSVSLGMECRVGGEVEATIIHGYTNKAHDGFLGHSYLGEWVNLGAGTQVSNLRTDYESVRIPIGGRSIATGLLKVGAFVGDHTKTSINALFNTGTVIGPFGQLLTSGSFLPRNLPAFCRFGHGQVHERNDLRQLFASAATAMSRRNQEWTDTLAEFYFALHDRTATERRQYLRENEQQRLRRVV